MEFERISGMANPKGGNQAPSIRIRGPLIFRVFSTSYQTRFFNKTIPIILNWTLCPLWGTRRDKIERPLSLGVVATSFVFSRHHTKSVFLIKPYLLSGIGPYLLYVEPEGTKSNALYHLVWWLLLSCSLDIIPKAFF